MNPWLFKGQDHDGVEHKGLPFAKAKDALRRKEHNIKTLFEIKRLSCEAGHKGNKAAKRLVAGAEIWS